MDDDKVIYNGLFPFNENESYSLAITQDIIVEIIISNGNLIVEAKEKQNTTVNDNLDKALHDMEQAEDASSK